MPKNNEKALFSYKAFLRLKCPSCKKGKLFESILKVKETCTQCGFNLKEHDSADGPAYTSLFVTSIVITFLAIIVELKLEPPFWVHVILWIPLICIKGLIVLIFAKSLFIHLQYLFNVDNFQGKKEEHDE